MLLLCSAYAALPSAVPRHSAAPHCHSELRGTLSVHNKVLALIQSCRTELKLGTERYRLCSSGFLYQTVYFPKSSSSVLVEQIQ